MFVESRSVSHTAGEFATRYLFSDDFMTKAKQAKVPKGVYYTAVCVCFVPDIHMYVCVCCRSQEGDGHPDQAGRVGEVLPGGQHPPACHLLCGQSLGLHSSTPGKFLSLFTLCTLCRMYIHFLLSPGKFLHCILFLLFSNSS